MARKRGSATSAKASRQPSVRARAMAKPRAPRRVASASAPKVARKPGSTRKPKAVSAAKPRRRDPVTGPSPTPSAPVVPTGIPERQWSLPAGFVAGSRRTANLKRVLDPGYKTLDGHDLDDEQRRELTLKRLARQRSFDFMTLDGRPLSKRRALAEVRKQTPLGRALVDIEHRTIALMCEWIRREQASASASDGAGIRSATPVDEADFKAHLGEPAPGTPAARARRRRSLSKTATMRRASAGTARAAGSTPPTRRASVRASKHVTGSKARRRRTRKSR